MAHSIEFENPLFVDDFASDFAFDNPDDDAPLLTQGVNYGSIGNAGGENLADVGNFFTTDELSLDQQNTANDYYKNLASDQGLSVPDLSSFTIGEDGRLRLKDYPGINLINSRTGRPNTLGYIASNWKGGGDAIRQKLGFPNWSPKLSAAAAAALRRANQKLGKAAKDTDNVKLRDMGQVMTEASNAVQTMETSFTELGQSGVPPIT